MDWFLGMPTITPVYFMAPVESGRAPDYAWASFDQIWCLERSHAGMAVQTGGWGMPSLPASSLYIKPVSMCSTEEHETRSTSVANLIRSLATTPNEWNCVEDGFYMRSHCVPELDICYIEEEDSRVRPMGSVEDWVRVGRMLARYHAALVVFQLTGEHAVIYENKKQPQVVAAKKALQFLRNCPTGLGLLMCVGRTHKFFYIEAWQQTVRTKRLKTNTVIERVAIAIVRGHPRVGFFW